MSQFRQRSIHISGGVRIALRGAPVQEIQPAAPPKAVALLGRDMDGMHPRLEVAEGDRVAAGQVLLRDRARPRIAFTAPAAGRVQSIEYGRRRTLSALIIACDGEAAVSPNRGAPLRDRLLDGGLWPSFRTRPFGRIPDPDAVPQAIFVTALDTAPLAPDPNVIITGNANFEAGLLALSELTEGPVYLCHAPGATPTAAGRITPVTVHGLHPAGLASAHVEHLGPPRGTAQVWTIGYQDVIAIGALITTGTPGQERVVALAGPMVRAPRLLRTVSGAHIGELIRDETPAQTHVRALAGDPISGHEAAFLGRADRQITVLGAPAPKRRTAMLSRLQARLPWHPSAAPRPILPIPALMRAIALNVPVLPLLRALCVGDIAAADRLGARHLVPEDMALATALCASGNDYGRHLAFVLDALAEEREAAA